MDPTEGIVEAVDEEENLMKSKFEKMDGWIGWYPYSLCKVIQGIRKTWEVV